MADISAYLNTIKKAIYGKDVRDSIYESIKKINEEVSTCSDRYRDASNQIDNLRREIDESIDDVASRLEDDLVERIHHVQFDSEQALIEIREAVDEARNEMETIQNELHLLEQNINNAVTMLENEIEDTRTTLSDLIISTNEALRLDTDARYSLVTDDLIGGQGSICPFRIITKPGLPQDIEYGQPTKGTLLRRGKWVKNTQSGLYEPREMSVERYEQGVPIWQYANVIYNFQFSFSVMDVMMAVNDGYSLDLLTYPIGMGETEEEIIFNGCPYGRDQSLFEQVVPDETGFYHLNKNTWFIMTLKKETGDFPGTGMSDVDEISNALIVRSVGQNIISKAAMLYHERVLNNLRNAEVSRNDTMTEGDVMKIVENPSVFKMSDLGEFSSPDVYYPTPKVWTEYDVSEQGTKTNTTEAYCYDVDCVLLFYDCDQMPDVYTGAYPYQLIKVQSNEFERFNGGYACTIPVYYKFIFGVYTNENDLSSVEKPLPSVKAFSKSEWERYKEAILVSVSEVTGGHSITITDVTGSHEFTVSDGAKGDKGDQGDPVKVVTSAQSLRNWVTEFNRANGYGICITLGDFSFNFTVERVISDETVTNTYTGTAAIGDVWAISPSTFELTKAYSMVGVDGEDGTDGTDGYSPTASVAKSGTTTTVTITDKNGTTTATISDGTDGADGVGIPSGGTTGQYLVKSGSSDYAAAWSTLPVQTGGDQGPAYGLFAKTDKAAYDAAVTEAANAVTNGLFEISVNGTDLQSSAYSAGSFSGLKADISVRELPAVTSADAGKVARVNSSGQWAAVSLPSASGVSF